MVKYIALTILLAFSSLTFAGTCEFGQSGLTKAQAQDLKIQCEQLRAETLAKAETSVDTITDAALMDPEQISAWGQIAQEFAKAIAIAAKEVGVEANNFLKSPLGLMTAAIVLWKVFAGQFFGIMFLIAGWVLWYQFYRNCYIKEYVEVTKTKRFSQSPNATYTERVPVKKTFSEFGENEGITLTVASIVILVYTLIMLGAVIF